MVCSRTGPCVKDGPAAQYQQLSSQEATMHVLGMHQAALGCSGYDLLHITPDEDLLQ